MDTASSESVIPTFGVCILCSFKNTVMSFFLKFFSTAHMSVGYFCVWCPRWPEENIGSSGTGVTNGFELPCGCRELIQILLKEHPVLVITENFFVLSLFYYI